MFKRILYFGLLFVIAFSFISCANEPNELQSFYNEMEGVWYSRSNNLVFSLNSKGEGYAIDSSGYTQLSLTFYKNNDSLFIRWSFTSSDGVTVSFEKPVEESEEETDIEKLSDKPAIDSGISQTHDPNIVGHWGTENVYNDDGTGKCNLYISGAYVLLDINWSTKNGVLTRVFYKDGAVYKTIKNAYVIYQKDGLRWLKLI